MLYMVTWIPSIYPLYVSIYTSTMDPSWVLDIDLKAMMFHSYSIFPITTLFMDCLRHHIFFHGAHKLTCNIL